MIFSTQVQGIPCQCQVTQFIPARPMKFSRASGDFHPPEGCELTFQILDRKGYRARWLEDKIRPDERERLAEEYQAALLADQYDIHF